MIDVPPAAAFVAEVGEPATLGGGLRPGGAAGEWAVDRADGRRAEVVARPGRPGPRCGAVGAERVQGGGQGDGSALSSDFPVRVKFPAGITVRAISAGSGHSLAVTTTGRLYAWGYNGDGEPGDGTTANADIPVRVKLPQGTKVTLIAAGEGHSLGPHLRREGAGLGRQQHRSAGQRHHHQQRHPG